MKLVLEKATTHFGAIVAAVVVFVMALVLVISSHVYAQADRSQNGTLITIHDRGLETVVLTQATTIGQALDEAGIEIGTQDVVEPDPDQEMVASEYNVNIYRARPVLVVDGETRQRVMTPYQTPKQIAESVGIKLYAEDETTITRSTDILTAGAGLELHIDRATPVSFQLYGKKSVARTQGQTVAEFLAEKEITLGENDKVSPSLSTPVTEDMAVTVWREGRQTVTVEESVAFSVQQIEDANQPVGYSAIQTAGKPGKKDVTYQIEIRDGKEVKRTEIASLVTEKPVTEVKVVGTYIALAPGYSADRVAIMNGAGIAAKDHGYAAYIIDNENALWCPIRWQGTAGCWATYAEKFPGAESSSQVGYGLCQATPANKMASAGSDWRTNPVTQMKWCSTYANEYGGWQAAAEFKKCIGSCYSARTGSTVYKTSYWW